MQLDSKIVKCSGFKTLKEPNMKKLVLLICKKLLYKKKIFHLNNFFHFHFISIWIISFTLKESIASFTRYVTIQIHGPYGVAGFPIGRLSPWWVGEFLPNMCGNSQIKYPKWTKIQTENEQKQSQYRVEAHTKWSCTGWSTYNEWLGCSRRGERQISSLEISNTIRNAGSNQQMSLSPRQALDAHRLLRISVLAMQICRWNIIYNIYLKNTCIQTWLYNKKFDLMLINRDIEIVSPHWRRALMLKFKQICLLD